MRRLHSRWFDSRRYILVSLVLVVTCLSVSLFIRQPNAGNAAGTTQSSIGSSTSDLSQTGKNTISQGGISDMLSTWLGSNAVAQHPNAATSLKERWAWGLTQSRQGENQTGCWMGYSISRLLDRDAYVGTVNVSALPRGSASRQERSLPAKELWQDVVFLFNLQGGTDLKDIRRIEVNNRPWILDRDKKPMVWLGRATEEESIHLLLDMYPRVGARDLKASIMVGAELHSEPEVLSQLAALLGREAYAGTDAKLQTDVLDVISHLPQDLGTPLLVEIARTHLNVKVRKEAVGYLADSEDEKAHEALKSLTRTP